MDILHPADYAFQAQLIDFIRQTRNVAAVRVGADGKTLSSVANNKSFSSSFVTNILNYSLIGVSYVGGLEVAAFENNVTNRVEFAIEVLAAMRRDSISMN